MLTKKQVMAGLLCGVAGFAGNWFNYPLFLNIDFLFGSFFVMLALLRYGPGAGITASIIASSCTWIMWHHPYALIIFTAETAVVGLLNRRRTKADILLHNLVYWVMIGGPLGWFCYHHLLHDTHASVLLIVLKQTMNGIFNALLASVVYQIYLFRARSGESLPSFRQLVYTIMVGLVLIPAFLYIFFDLRSLSAARSQQLAVQTERFSASIATIVAGWLENNQQTVNALAKRIGDPGRRTNREMQELIETVNDGSPEIFRIGVFDSKATVVAYSPTTDDRGNTTVGINVADRAYFEQLQRDKQPIIVGVVPSKFGNKLPVVPLVAPILVDGVFKGFCSGVLQTETLLKHIKFVTSYSDLQVTILDQHGQVVFSTRSDLAVMKPYPTPEKWTIKPINIRVEHRIPPPLKGRNLMQRWGSSFYVTEDTVSSVSHWKVIVESAYAPLLADLRENATNALAGLVLLSLLVAPIATLLSRLLSRSLEQLQQFTRTLPEDIAKNQSDILPDSSLLEIADLINNFSITRGALQRQYNELMLSNSQLQESETKLRMVLAAGNMATWEWNIQSGAVTWNDEHFIMMGYTPGEVQPSYAAWAERIHPDDRAAVCSRIKECMEQNLIYSAEFRSLWSDGTIRWLEARGRFTYDDGGLPLNNFGVMRDFTAKKETEAAMQLVLSRLSQAQLSAKAGLWAWDIQRNEITWSPELFNLFGLDPQSNPASFALWRQLLHPDDLSVADIQVNYALEKRERLSNEYRILTPTGEIRWIAALGDTVFDADGKPLQMSGICLDISERKFAEERLKILADTSALLLLSESPQETVEAICRNALAILDCQLFFNFLVVPEVNRLRLNACAGISAADAENIEWLDFGSAICGCVASDSCRVVAEDIQNTTDERAALVRSYGVKAYACHPLLRAETVIGTLSFGSFNKICFTEEELRLMKAITDMVAIAMERKRIEESLLRAKREWEMTFDSLPDLISIIDDQYRILRVNRPMARFLGRNPQDCIGMHCFAEMHGGDAPLCNCPHEQALIDHQTHEIEIYDEAGERTYLVSATPLQMDDGRLIGSVHIARDITAQKRAELVLKQSHEILEEMIDERTDQLKDTIHVLQCEVLEREKTQKSLEFEMSEKLQIMESLREQEKLLILQSRQAAMGEMIGNIAHQWRQPLNILGLHLQQLGLYHEAGKFNTEYLHESIRKGMGIIQHMSKTIDDFRNFFCPEKEIKLFSLQETISNAVAIISDSFASHTITINVCNEPDLEVLGFANEFSQALLNILLNAKDVLLERQTEQPIITLQVEKTADKAVISIKDNAGGMKEEIIDKIFDPYFTTKGPQQGTGLGLYMAKMIIEKNMGGRLTARNNADGAEFCIEVNQAA